MECTCVHGVVGALTANAYDTDDLSHTIDLDVKKRDVGESFKTFCFRKKLLREWRQMCLTALFS